MKIEKKNIFFILTFFKFIYNRSITFYTCIMFYIYNITVIILQIFCNLLIFTITIKFAVSKLFHDFSLHEIIFVLKCWQILNISVFFGSATIQRFATIPS